MPRWQRPASTRDRGAFLKISQKHVDFLVVNKEWSVVAAIELNDRTHDAPHRREITSGTHDLKSACNTLIERANGNGGPDNITVVLAKVIGSG